MVRCFIAFDLEDGAILGRIRSIQNALLSAGVRLKLVEPENLHVTLRFLGEVPEQRISAISEKLSEVEFPYFEFLLKGVGGFPSSIKPRVIWIGIEKGVDELRRVYSQVESKLREIGFPSEKREFEPHITIARVKSWVGAERLAKQLEGLRDMEFGIVKATYLKLKKSILTSKGPIYSDLFKVKAKE